MTGADQNLQDLGEQFLRSLDKTHVNAAASKLFAASVGEIVMLLSRSPAHKHYSLADIEWMVLPAVMAGQFYVVEATHKEHGIRVPVAFVSWAFVSEEVNQLLQQQASPLRRLRPDQWKSGGTGWLIDAVGEAEPMQAALQWLAAGPFKEQPLKMSIRSADGATGVTTLEAVLARQAKAEL